MFFSLELDIQWRGDKIYRCTYNYNCKSKFMVTANKLEVLFIKSFSFIILRCDRQ